jgi:hypothetical protein
MPAITHNPASSDLGWYDIAKRHCWDGALLWLMPMRARVKPQAELYFSCIIIFCALKLYNGVVVNEG